MDLRSESDDSIEDILTIWKEQDFRDKVNAEEKARGIALDELIQQHEIKIRQKEIGAYSVKRTVFMPFVSFPSGSLLTFCTKTKEKI